MNNIDNVPFLIIWPNPGKNFLKVKYGLDEDDYDFLDIEILSSFSKEKLSKNNFSKFNYFLTFYGNPFIVLPGKDTIKQLKPTESETYIKEFLTEDKEDKKSNASQDNKQRFIELFRKPKTTS